MLYIPTYLHIPTIHPRVWMSPCMTANYEPGHHGVRQQHLLPRLNSAPPNINSTLAAPRRQGEMYQERPAPFATRWGRCYNNSLPMPMAAARTSNNRKATTASANLRGASQTWRGHSYCPQDWLVWLPHHIEFRNGLLGKVKGNIMIIPVFFFICIHLPNCLCSIPDRQGLAQTWGEHSYCPYDWLSWSPCDIKTRKYHWAR